MMLHHFGRIFSLSGIEGQAFGHRQRRVQRGRRCAGTPFDYLGLLRIFIDFRRHLTNINRFFKTFMHLHIGCIRRVLFICLLIFASLFRFGML